MFKGLFGPSFSKKTLKPHLKQAVIRFNVHKQKRGNSLKQERRALAGLLKDGKIDAARIRAEAVIRKEREDQASEILSLMCNLLHERVDLIATTKECPADLKESVCTVMWATARVQVDELKTVKEQFACKYGDEFKLAAVKDIGDCVNPKVKNYMSVMPPSTEQVLSKLREIAEEHKVEFDAEKLGKVWAPEPEPLPPLPPMSGDSSSGGGGGGGDPAAFGAPVGPAASRGPSGSYGGGYPAAPGPSPGPYPPTGGPPGPGAYHGGPGPYHGGPAPGPYPGGPAPGPYPGGPAPGPYPGGPAPGPYPPSGGPSGGQGGYPSAPRFPDRGGDVPSAFPMPGGSRYSTPDAAVGAFAPGAHGPSGGVDPGLPALPSYGGTTTVPPGPPASHNASSDMEIPPDAPGAKPSGGSTVGIDEIEAKFRMLREAHGKV